MRRNQYHEFADFEGSFARRIFAFRLNVTIPPSEYSEPATEAQLFAVQQFFSVSVDTLKRDQAHTMLCCREYARICAESILKKYPAAVRAAVAKPIAAFVLSDPQMTEFARKWSERNFERGTGSPRVRGTPYYLDCEEFVSHLESMWGMQGWTLQELKKLRYP